MQDIIYIVLCFDCDPYFSCELVAVKFPYILRITILELEQSVPV